MECGKCGKWMDLIDDIKNHISQAKCCVVCVNCGKYFIGFENNHNGKFWGELVLPSMKDLILIDSYFKINQFKKEKFYRGLICNLHGFYNGTFIVRKTCPWSKGAFCCNCFEAMISKKYIKHMQTFISS